MLTAQYSVTMLIFGGYLQFVTVRLEFQYCNKNLLHTTWELLIPSFLKNFCCPFFPWVFGNFWKWQLYWDRWTCLSEAHEGLEWGSFGLPGPRRPANLACRSEARPGARPAGQPGFDLQHGAWHWETRSGMLWLQCSYSHPPLHFLLFWNVLRAQWPTSKTKLKFLKRR